MFIPLVQSAIFAFLIKRVCGMRRGLPKYIAFAFVFLLKLTIAIWEFMHRLTPTYYDILKASVYDSPQSIQSSFRRQSLILHPDRNPSLQAASAFKNLMEAYEILLNPETRWKYDSVGDISYKGEMSLYLLYIISWLFHSRFLEFYCFAYVVFTFIDDKKSARISREVFSGILLSFCLIDILLRNQLIGSTESLFMTNQFIQLTNFQWSLFIHYILPLVFSFIIALGVACAFHQEQDKEEANERQPNQFFPETLTFELAYNTISRMFLSTQYIARRLKEHCISRLEQFPLLCFNKESNIMNGPLVTQFDRLLIERCGISLDLDCLSCFEQDHSRENIKAYKYEKSAAFLLDLNRQLNLKQATKKSWFLKYIGPSDILVFSIVLAHQVF